MKATPVAQRQLLDLAAVDAELSRIDHQRRALPELAEIAEIEKLLRARRDSQVAAETAAFDLDREIGRQEREIESVRARQDRDRALLDSGSIAAKQMSDVEHELQTLARRQTALEDDLLELMERREALALDIKRTSAEVEEADERLNQAKKRYEEAVVNLDTSQVRRDAERTELLPNLPADLVDLYEKARARKGIGAALLRSRRCGSCRLDIDRSTIAEIKAASEDEVVQCENCDAILVRTAESGL